MSDFFHHAGKVVFYNQLQTFLGPGGITIPVLAGRLSFFLVALAAGAMEVVVVLFLSIHLQPL